jgi:hypothetical protein
VRGLGRFAGYFADHQDQYVLIGGSAIVLTMEDAGLTARVTKDLDIVLCLEVLDPAFVRAFWAFVKAGGYQTREKSDGKRAFYRFMKPADATFPEMLELFSRKPDALTLRDGQHLTPIPAGGEADSLSAILLDDDYYAFLHTRKEIVQTIPVVDIFGLIPLKARAWLDLSARKRNGEEIDSKNITKHRNDVLRLFQMVNREQRIDGPQRVRSDVGLFLDALDANLDLKPYGLSGIKVAEVVEVLKTVYAVWGA